MGDVCNAIGPAVLESLSGQVDVLLALTGAHAPVALEDLDKATAVIAPRSIIPIRPVPAAAQLGGAGHRRPAPSPAGLRHLTSFIRMLEAPESRRPVSNGGQFHSAGVTGDR
jgi:hypothetical protein